MRHIATWILVALAFLALPHIIPGITIGSFKTALIIAVIWGLVNLLIKPIISLVLLPITLITLGLFSFVINALLFWGISWLAHLLGVGFNVNGFIPALLGSLVISVATFIAHKILAED
jgi:putative membrane protein